MKNTLPKIIFRYSQTQKIPLSLTYPYEYTLTANEFAFVDVRFTEVPFSKELWKHEKEHVQTVLSRFQQILNGQKQKLEIDQYILPCLRSKAEELLSIQKQSEFQLNFQFHIDSATKSSGYYEIKPQLDLSLSPQSIQPIHNYKFYRQKEILKVELKQKPNELTPQEQLKQDIAERMGNPGKEIKQQIEKLTVSKQAVYYNRLMEGFLSIGKKTKKNNTFEPYYIVDQIKGTLSCSLTHQGNTYQDGQVEFDTKWLYYVTNLQSNELKKYRKRTLFDFQFWNRGNFFPLKNFAAETVDMA